MRKDLANLNTLRAFAVTAVLISHLLLMLAALHIISGSIDAGTVIISGYSLDAGALGQAGVAAFFVHTSLVLMFSLERLPEHARTIAFYIRRIFRIYPLAILCIALVLLFRIPSAPWANPFYRHVSKMELISNVFLIQNVTGVRSISSPMWSLPFEIQMYVVLPLLFGLASMRRAIPPLRAISIVLALMVAFGGFTLIFRHRAGLPFILAYVVAYVPCFLSGVLAYGLRFTRPFLPSVLWPFFVMLWIGLRGGGIFHTLHSGPSDEWVATVLLGASIYCFHDSTNRLWNGVVRIIAKYSYGVYLGHVPVMWLVLHVMQIHNPVVSIMLWLVGTAAAAVAAFHLLEEPMINAGRAITASLVSKPRLDPVAVGDW